MKENSEMSHLKTNKSAKEIEVNDSAFIQQTPDMVSKVNQIAPLISKTLDRIEENYYVRINEPLPEKIEKNAYQQLLENIESQKLVDEGNLSILNKLKDTESPQLLDFYDPVEVHHPTFIKEKTYNGQMMSSPCSRYTLYTAIVDQGEMPSSVVSSMTLLQKSANLLISATSVSFLKARSSSVFSREMKPLRPELGELIKEKTKKKLRLPPSILKVGPTSIKISH
jgi:hypothetical protein